MNTKNTIAAIPSAMQHGIIISDADGVCVDFTHGFYRYMQEVHGLTATATEPSAFNYADAFPELEKPSAYIPEYMSSEYFKSTPIYPEAMAAFNAIHDAGGKIDIVTSCGINVFATDARIELLNRELGHVIRNITVLGFGECKQKVLSKMKGDAFIDDLFDVCKTAASVGHKAYLFDRKYNQETCDKTMNEMGIVRAKSWHDLHIFNDRN
jgi:hypothetical protein